MKNYILVRESVPTGFAILTTTHASLAQDGGYAVCQEASRRETPRGARPLARAVRFPVGVAR